MEEILQILSKYIDVKKTANNYVAHCPFHDPKTIPAGHINALIINVKENKWHCFDCGKGGNAQDFKIMYEENIY